MVYLIKIVFLFIFSSIKISLSSSYDSNGDQDLIIPIKTIPKIKNDTKFYTSQWQYIECGLKITVGSCLKYNCTSPDSELLVWQLPSHLLQYQQDGYPLRMESSQSRGWMDGTSYRFYHVISSINFTDLGFIHRGNYSCVYKLGPHVAHDSMQLFTNIKENSIKSCQYPDQCETFSCNNKQCQCTKDEPVFVNNKCYPESEFSKPCSESVQCLHSKPYKNRGVQCLNGTCQCENGYVIVKLPEWNGKEFVKGTFCLKNASLNQNCNRSEQCKANDGNSFCNLNLVCKCNNGYYESNGHCVARQKCTLSLDDNPDDIKQGDCKDSTTFCHNGVCLCRPDFKQDQNDNKCYYRYHENWFKQNWIYILIGVASLAVISLSIFIIWRFFFYKL